MDIVAIVSSFNRAALLESALGSLLAALAELPWRAAVYVIDAGSADGSQRVVERMAANSDVPVRLIERAGISFAAGVNLAVAQATAAYPAAKYIFLFETDNHLQSASPVAAAVSLLEREASLGAAGFTVRKQDGAPAGFGCPHPGLFEFVLGPQIAFRLKLDSPKISWKREATLSWAECDAVYTSPLLIRREAWEATNGFDAEAFPFSDCDLDWAWRLRRAGFRQAVIQTAEVVHDNQQSPSSWSARRSLLFHRARFALLHRRCGLISWLAVPLLALRHLAELVVTLLYFGRGKEYSVAVRKRAGLFFRCFKGYG